MTAVARQGNRLRSRIIYSHRLLSSQMVGHQISVRSCIIPSRTFVPINARPHDRSVGRLSSISANTFPHNKSYGRWISPDHFSVDCIVVGERSVIIYFN